MLDYDSGQLAKMSLDEKNRIVHPDDMEGWNKYWESSKTLPNDVITSFEYRANMQSRGWIWLRARGKVFERDENGQVKTVLHVVQDITDRKYAELKIQLLNKELVINNKALESANSEINMFSNIAATDYSDTLRHLYTSLEHIVVQDARKLSDSGRANLRRAQAAIQKMRLLTDDLMSYTKLQETVGKKQDLDVNNLIESSLKELAAQLDGFTVEMECRELTIYGYPSLVSMLFRHLIENAIKFRKEDKPHRIHISCQKSVSGSSIENRAANKNLDYHIVTVKDNGIGIAPEDEERIFEIFTRLHEKNRYKGSGTGLAICRKIMDMHGGFIIANGSHPEGASFHCFFPV